MRGGICAYAIYDCFFKYFYLIHYMFSFLHRQVVWITGASSGIGEAMAMAAAQQGACLVLSARRAGELERVAALCRQNGATSCMTLPLDVAQTDDIPQAVAQVQALHAGRIDILVNNAGISQRALALDTDLEVDKRLMAVNYIGTVALSKAVLPLMLAQGSGILVTISSLVGKFGTPYRSGYAASKHALHGFFDALRAELYGKNIQITLLCPGFVRTNVTLNALTEHGEVYNQMDESTEKGMLPADFARLAWRAVARRREEAYIGGRETWAVYLKRWLPTLFSRFVRRAKVK